MEGVYGIIDLLLLITNIKSPERGFYETKYFEGDEKYIFVSYAHKDSEAVFKVLKELEKKGYRFWYDDGIAPGSEWPEDIAQHINGSQAVLSFITPAAVVSRSCRREINYALGKNKPFLSVFLEKTDMQPGMEMQLSSQQSILRYNYATWEAFISKILKCPDIALCKQEEPEAVLQDKVQVVAGEPLHSDGTGSNLQTPNVHSGSTSNGNKKTDSKRRVIIASILAAVLICVGALGYKLIFSSSEPPAQTAVLMSDSVDVVLTDSDGISVNDVEKVKNAHVFGSDEYLRSQIVSISFLDSLKEAPEDSWAVSVYKDDSVKAWVEPSGEDMYHLYIAADGGMQAPVDCYLLFAGYENSHTIAFNNSFQVDNTTDMSGMFMACGALEEIDLTGFNTEKVTDMCAMFNQCSRLKKIKGIESLNTSSVVSMSSLFENCGFKTIDLSGFDTGSVENFSWMFARCPYLEKLNLSGIDTSSVTNMMCMFYDCKSLVNLDISSFNTSGVKDMRYMFSHCEKLPAVIIGDKFDMSSASKTEQMFLACYKLESLPEGFLDLTSAIETRKMFWKCSSLKELTINSLVCLG